MIQTQLLDLVNAPSGPAVKENPLDLFNTFTAAPCSDCRLGIHCPTNTGFLFSGNTNAKIAFLYDIPTLKDMYTRRVLVGNPWSYEFDLYLKHMKLTWSEVLVTGLAQCPIEFSEPKSGKGKKEKKGVDYKKAANDYEKDIKTCFYTRTLPFLKSLPNLQVLVLLGWQVPKILFGGSPGPKTHEGEWFHSPTLPGVVLFCIDHPRNHPGDDTKISKLLEWRNRRQQCLESFAAFYRSGKILKILKIFEEAIQKGETVDLDRSLEPDTHHR